MTDLLVAENLRVRFRIAGLVQAKLAAIEDPFIDAVMAVSFSLAQGETLGLVGESGSGKTTLGRAIIGLVEAQSGSITFAGQELVGLPTSAYKAVRREIAMMFQDPIASLSPRKTVRNQIVEPYKIHGLAVSDLRAEARRLLQMVGLHDGFMNAFPHQLSGGQGAPGRGGPGTGPQSQACHRRRAHCRTGCFGPG